MIRRIIALVFIAGVLVAVLLLLQQRGGPLRVSGYIEADEIRLGSRVGGRVLRVLAQEGQQVEKDEVLVELEPYDLRERLAEAQAVAAEKLAQLDRLKAGYRPEEIAQAKAKRDQLAAHLEKLRAGPRAAEIESAEAEVELAQAEVELAQQNHERTTNLFNSGTGTQEAMDEATNQLKVAQARLRARSAQLELLREGTRIEEIRQAEAELHEAEQAWLLHQHGFRSEDIAQAEAALAAAHAAVAVVQQQLEELNIRAPAAGTIEAVELQPGDLVSANAPAISLVDMSRLWVRAYVPEDALYVQLGQRLDVTVDSYPEQRFAGEVTFIARQAEFTPGNVQTPEERSQQVFRIKVDLREGLDQLRPGMAADVWLRPRGD